jgi:sterol desaturase/sphingolipid hydroxylase (fatty acid hydroxylase superfamily)
MLSGITLLFTIIVIELIFLYKKKGNQLPWNEIITNINSGHIMVWLFRGLILFAYNFISVNYSLSYFEQIPIYLQWTLVIIGWDFCFYWSHRFHHTLDLLWKIHHTHHQPEHFNLSLGIRNSWYQPISSFPFFSILAFSGVPTEQFILASGIHYFVQVYNHNSFINKSGFLEKILMTPSHHRVHHGTNKEYLGKNLGGTFIIWDKLFGTFQKELNDVKIKYGTLDSINPKNPFWANMAPFFQSFLTKQDDEKNKKQTQESKSYYTVTGSFFLFLLFLVYINYEHVWSFESLAPLFIIIFSGTISLGSISNGKKMGLIVWSILTIPASILFIIILGIEDPVLLLVLCAIITHGLVGLWSLLKFKKI